MKVLEDGNFAGWLRIAMFVAGVALLFAGLGIEAFPRWARLALFLIGFVTMAVGGFTSRAHMLKIKPFDNSYKKARESYKVKDDDQDKSQ
jgi:hypothetical protein